MKTTALLPHPSPGRNDFRLGRSAFLPIFCHRTLARLAGLLFAAFLTVGSALPGAGEEPSALVFVSLAGDKRIDTYRLNLTSGALEPTAKTPTTGEPGYLAFDRSGNRLFVCYRSTGELSSYRIDPQTGNLELLSLVAAGADPAYCALDRSEKFLLSAYYRAAKIGIHQIDDQGVIDPQSAQWHSTAANAHAVQVDRSNRWALVPHTGPNAIFLFSLHANDGRLAPGNPPRFSVPVGTGPRHLQFHPKLDRVYFDNEQGSSVSAFAFDPQTGRLEHRQTLPTIPRDFDQRNTCADLEISPDGRWLYASNRGHDSIAGFRIDPDTGELTSLGQFPTEPTPRSFALDTSGSWLIAASQKSGYLQLYRIDPDTGRLVSRSRTKAGGRPWAVAVINPSP